ncbi:COG1361 S-layer family protein [Methanohalophilus profundi]|uniref:COG1361 S-layer family protein n=1 Tax=Methanohalophilus profundi TaxID=2138083 RepID=UPI00101CFBAD|nr:COG1361 S-layer family protein [Methanohalophilus profundi]
MNYKYLTAVFLILIFMSSATAYISTAAIEINLTNLNPDTARPGEPVEIVLSAQNVGNSDIEDVIVEVEPEYPFSKIEGESLTREVAYLDARQGDEDAATLKFKLMTDPDAAEGVYEIDIKTSLQSEDDDPYTITQTVELEVRGKEYAQIVTINKASISPGSEEGLEFIITNVGNSPLKNMVVSWVDQEGVILPIYSDNTRYINYLDAGESINVAYSVMADVNADPGLYTLNITLEFDDYESTSDSIETTAGIFVGGGTDFDVSFSESDSGTISLSLANIGNNEAYSVKVSIPEQQNYKTTGSSSSIVGNLEKGDYTIASFNILSVNNNTQNNDLQVMIEYTDSLGTRHSVTKEVPIQSYSTGTGTMPNGNLPDNKSGSNVFTNPYLIGSILLVVLVGAFYYWKKKKTAHQNGNE